MFDVETNAIAVGGELLVERRAEPWQELHAALKNIGVKRARLDAKELDLLFEAEEMGLFRRLGYPTMQAYMIAELECSRHTPRCTTCESGSPGARPISCSSRSSCRARRIQTSSCSRRSGGSPVGTVTTEYLTM
jgi:hypothetical protein